jgi:hypothetical protein
VAANISTLHTTCDYRFNLSMHLFEEILLRKLHGVKFTKKDFDMALHIFRMTQSPDPLR